MTSKRGGPTSLGLQRVQACMDLYLSPILVRGMLDKTLAKRGCTIETADDAVVPAVVEDSMIGLRLFVAPDQLPALMLELAEILETLP